MTKKILDVRNLYPKTKNRATFNAALICKIKASRESKNISKIFKIDVWHKIDVFLILVDQKSFFETFIQ